MSSLQIVNGINTAITTNAASAENYGAEAQLSTSVTSDFNVSVGVAYTHARYKEFPEASYNAITATGLNTTHLRESSAAACDDTVVLKTGPASGLLAHRI